MLEFTESLTTPIHLPKIAESYASISEQIGSKGLIAEFASIHAGMTANHNMYSPRALKESLETWTNPYPKPIITNHDVMSEPLGRVMSAKIGKENGNSFINLQTAILNSEAVAKLLDGRYMTGSVGGAVEHAFCSICKADWAANANMFEMPCEHRRGNLYEGKLCYFDMQGITWKEYSLVNVPADGLSSVRSMKIASTESLEEQLSNSVHFFCVDLAKESVYEISESENRDILDGVRRKEANPIYNHFKGSFLQAIAAESLADNDKETQTVSNSDVTEGIEEDDILAVSEALSEDLATDAEASEEAGDDTDTDAGESDTDETDAEESDEAGDDTDTDADADEADAESGADADAEEDTTEESGDESDASDEEEGDTDEDDTSEESDSDESEESEGEQAASEESDENDADINENADERVTALEAEVADLTAKLEAKGEENLRLRKALKVGLVERVIDKRIDLGLSAIEERQTLIDEFSERTASSLADALKDLNGMKPMAHSLEGLGRLGEDSVTVENVDTSDTNTQEQDQNDSDSGVITEEDVFHFLMKPKNS